MSRRYPPFDPFERTPFQVQEIRIPRPPRRFWIGVGLIAAAFVLLLIANPVVIFITNIQWYNALGIGDVYLTRVGLQLLLFLGSLLVAFLFAAANVAVPLRSRQGGPLRAVGISRRWLRSGAGVASLSGAALLALILSFSVAGRWQDLVLFQHATATGTTEPLFGMDVAFYLLQLPLLHDAVNWFLGLTFLTALLTGLAYSWRGDHFDFNLVPSAIAHLSIVVGLLLLGLAASAFLGRYDLVSAHNGVVFGAGYADVNARAPIALVRALVAALLALALFANVVLRRLLIPAIALGLWLVLLFVAGLYPGFVQSVVVRPAELQQERPYIQREITYTRKAYALDQVQQQSFTGDAPLTANAVADDQSTIDNLRLWDYQQLLDTYNQLQTIRTYYGFKDVDLDRYTIDGKLQQVELAAREMEVGRLSQQAQTWFNQHLVYTHGYGLAMSPVSATDQQGLPTYLVSDIPPTGVLPVTQPDIYFGEETEDYAIAPSATREFDHPASPQDVYQSYKGTHGVKLGGFNRTLWSLRLSDFNLLVSSQVNSQSQVLFNRDILARTQEIAPFLDYDQDPYLVVVNGKLYWVIDAFTEGSTYPYAQDTTLADGTHFNYIRNSVKVVVDPYEGTATYYVNDPSDPILKAYRAAFPSLFKPIDQMPAGLRSHLRVPERMFAAQAIIYGTYHVTDPETLYSRNDVWDIPKEQSGPSNVHDLPPYYVLMRLPGQTQPEFLLIQPFVLHGKTNLIGWLGARMDSPHYGEYDVYGLPRDRVIVGPQQVSAFIQQQPDFSRDVSLLNAQGSSLVQGNLLVVPIGDTFLYFQPVYLRSSGGTSVPELKKVLLAHGDRVVYADNVAAALSVLVGQPVTAPSGPPSSGGTGTGTGNAATLQQLVSDALLHYNNAQQALKNGDLAAYAREMQTVSDDLQKIQAASGAAPPASPSPGASPRPSPSR